MSRICSCLLLSSIYYLNQEAFVQAGWRAFWFKNLAMQTQQRHSVTEFKVLPLQPLGAIWLYLKKNPKSLPFCVVCLWHWYCPRDSPALGSAKVLTPSLENRAPPAFPLWNSTWVLQFFRMGWLLESWKETEIGVDLCSWLALECTDVWIPGNNLLMTFSHQQLFVELVALKVSSKFYNSSGLCGYLSSSLGADQSHCGMGRRQCLNSPQYFGWKLLKLWW